MMPEHIVFGLAKEDITIATAEQSFYLWRMAISRPDREALRQGLFGH